MDIFNHVDIVILLIILYFTFFGWVQGIMRFLLGFLAFFISAYIALTNFQGSQNILESLKIFFLLSITLSFLAWLGLTFWNKTIVKSQRCTPLSRYLGAAAGFCWAASLVSAVTVFLVLVPADHPFLKDAKTLSQSSCFYTLLEQHILSRYPLYKTLQKLYEQSKLPPGSLPEANFNLTNNIPSEDLEALKQDEKLQEALSDKQIRKMMEEKDFGGLLSNSKIQNLLQDKAFVQKLLKVYNSMASGQ